MMYFPGLYTFRCLSLILRHGIHYTKIHLASVLVLKFMLFAPLIWINELILSIKLNKVDHKEIPIVFILGYWRSATTYLQNQIALDLNYTTLNIYSSLFPEHAFVSKRFFLNPLNKLVERLSVRFEVHRTKLDLRKNAEEEVAILSLCDSSSLNLFHFFPSLYPIDQDDNQRSRYIKSYVKLIKCMYLSDKSKGLVLKSPTNLSCIQQLHTEFPNAKYVYIHREKEDVIKSNKYLWSLIKKRTSLQKLSDERINYIIEDSYNNMLSIYNRDKILIKDNLIEVEFKDICEHPELTINQVKCQLGLE